MHDPGSIITEDWEAAYVHYACFTTHAHTPLVLILKKPSTNPAKFTKKEFALKISLNRLLLLILQFRYFISHCINLEGGDALSPQHGQPRVMWYTRYETRTVWPIQRLIFFPHLKLVYRQGHRAVWLPLDCHWRTATAGRVIAQAKVVLVEVDITKGYAFLRTILCPVLRIISTAGFLRWITVSTSWFCRSCWTEDLEHAWQDLRHDGCCGGL